MGAACLAFGMAASAKISSLRDPRVLIPTLMLAGALFLGAMILALVSRWRKRQENETLTTHDQLAQFRVLYERGELSAEEFDRVRRKLLARLKHELAEAAPKPAATPPSTAETETPPGPQSPLPSSPLTETPPGPQPPLPPGRDTNPSDH